MCKTCKIVHEPPTGKHCPRRDDIPAANGASSETAMLPLLMDLKQQMDSMREEMRTMRSTNATGEEDQSEVVAASPDRVPEEDSDDSDSEQASPESLRRDRRLMRQAAKRLSRLRWDSDDDEQSNNDGKRTSGKKSGSVLTATDKVRKSIDWPQMYVRRVTKGSPKGVVFRDLKVEEFVYGFLKMLAAPDCKLDSGFMINMLTDIMQDAMEFSWPNARSFYEQVGINVEMGMIQWTDEQAVGKLRMQYSRTVFPAVKDTKEYNKTPLVQAPPNTKCCVPYQTRTCEQERDHQPFVHACAYCHKSKSVICRHPENDCYRKANDISKNGGARGPNSSLPQ